MKLVIIILSFFLSAPIFAQNWAKVGDGFDLPVRWLNVDTSTNTLYASGNFFSLGPVFAKSIAAWNNSYWDSVPGVNQLSVNRIYPYNNKLLLGTNPVFIQNGVSTDTFEVFTWGGASGHTIYNNNLIVFGGFENINGVSANWIAKWNGTNWSAFDTTQWGGAPITCAKEYKGQLYIGGNMYTDNPLIDRIARWDGISWQPVANGIHGSMAFVWDMEVYNGDLYIAGTFDADDGNPGNGIARWDGTQWLQVGSGINGSIRDLQIYNNELYAAGPYSIMDNMTIRDISKWNGTRWCGVGFSGGADCLAVYNNDLYVGGQITAIDGDTMNNITKWIGGSYTSICGTATNVPETEDLANAFSLYPNPTNDKLNCVIDKPTPHTTLQLFTPAGRAAAPAMPVTQTNTEMDVSTLPAGLYFLQLQDDKQRVVKKLVKY